MTERSTTTSQIRLAALGARLAARRMEVDLTARGLVVRNPQVPGCCEEQPTAADTITCRSRGEGDDRTWFWTSWGEPIAPADQITDATAAVLRYLGGHARQVGADR